MKITSAMKMVSAAKFRKAQNGLLKFRPFNEGIKGMIQGLITTKGQGNVDYISPRKSVNNAAILLITSNNSLCGAFNSNIIREAVKIYGGIKTKHPNANITFYCLGKKGEEVLRREGYNVIALNHDYIDKPNVQCSKEIAGDLIGQYTSKKVDYIEIAYNRFKNAASQEPTGEAFLPLKNIASKTGRVNYNKPIIEPNTERLLDKLFPFYLLNRLHSAILESSASEHGARMTAMHLATENATALRDDLLLEYNKARQSAITDEIIEIVSGAAAQKG